MRQPHVHERRLHPQLHRRPRVRHDELHDRRLRADLQRRQPSVQRPDVRHWQVQRDVSGSCFVMQRRQVQHVMWLRGQLRLRQQHVPDRHGV